MHIEELEKVLSDSLRDFKLDQKEKSEFREMAETLENDQLRFLRNRAFELAHPYMEKGGTEAIKVLNWLERVVKAVQPVCKDNRILPSAYFSPGDSCRNKIISLIEGAKRAVDICVFTISDNEITQSILDAYHRGVNVTIISDNAKANDKGSDVDFLASKGVKVILDNSPYHMHHKFAIFDNMILLNGSFNWTRSATDVNEENIAVTADSGLVSTFGEQFEKLKDKFS